MIAKIEVTACDDAREFVTVEATYYPAYYYPDAFVPVSL